MEGSEGQGLESQGREGMAPGLDRTLWGPPTLEVMWIVIETRYRNHTRWRVKVGGLRGLRPLVPPED